MLFPEATARSASAGGRQERHHIELDLLEIVVGETQVMEGHGLPFQLLQGGQGRRALPGENRVIDHGVGAGEIHHLGPSLGIGHALQHIHLTPVQGLAHLAPVPQLELHLQPHDIGDGLHQIDVVADRIAILIQELVRRIVPVPPHHDHGRAVGLVHDDVRGA